MNCVFLCIYIEREIHIIFVGFLNYVVFVFIFQFDLIIHYIYLCFMNGAFARREEYTFLN